MASWSPSHRRISGISLVIRGVRRQLTPKQEEMAMAWARKKDTPYVQDAVFQANFLRDFSMALGVDPALTLGEVDLGASVRDGRCGKARQGSDVQGAAQGPRRPSARHSARRSRRNTDSPSSTASAWRSAPILRSRAASSWGAGNTPCAADGKRGPSTIGHHAEPQPGRATPGGRLGRDRVAARLDVGGSLGGQARRQAQVRLAERYGARQAAARGRQVRQGHAIGQ